MTDEELLNKARELLEVNDLANATTLLSLAVHRGIHLIAESGYQEFGLSQRKWLDWVIDYGQNPNSSPSVDAAIGLAHHYLENRTPDEAIVAFLETLPIA